MKGYELAKKITELALEKKGENIKIIDATSLKLHFEYFVLITGVVDQHLKALSEYIRKELSRMGVKPIGYEGQSNTKWVLLDYFDVIVHIFDPGSREIYKLEELWKDVKIESVE
ncbi:MAG: ribosome silencing factor [Candidatus Delongbacteria bacterium]|nr:ribosome silencing factor [Candidatus Delongbacteria bacterium]